MFCVVKKERVRVTERTAQNLLPDSKDLLNSYSLFKVFYTRKTHKSSDSIDSLRQVSYWKLLHYSLSFIYTPYGQLLTHSCVVIDWTLPSDFKKKEGSCEKRREGKDNNRHVEEGSEREKE